MGPSIAKWYAVGGTQGKVGFRCKYLAIKFHTWRQSSVSALSGDQVLIVNQTVGIQWHIDIRTSKACQMSYHTI